MYVELKTDDRRAVLDFLDNLVAGGERAQITLSKPEGGFTCVRALVGEAEEAEPSAPT